MAKGERKRVTHERRSSFLLPSTTAEAKLADGGPLSPISDASGANTPAQSYFPVNGHAHAPTPYDSGALHQRGGTSPRGEPSAVLPPPPKMSYAPTGGWNDLPASFGSAPPPPRPQPNGRHPSPAPPAAPTLPLV